MPILVHLTPEKNVKRILHSGIRKSKWSGVYCLPVLQNYYASHQWLRELRRSGQRNLVGVYFRVPDDEMVWFGHYSRPHRYLPVNEAIRLLMSVTDPQGYEMIIARAISPKEIHKIQAVPQVVGWRYAPGVRSRSWCICPMCVSPGEFKSSKKKLQHIIRLKQHK